MFKILDEACTPTRGTKYSAAIDLRSREDIAIGAGETVLVPLGIKINGENSLKGIAALHYAMGLHSHRHSEMLDKFKTRHYLQLMLRSGLGKKGLILPNGVGVIDLDYQDEIMMIIHNASGNKFEIKKGDRVGQITLLEHKSYLFGVDSDEVRSGGFGSTGSK